MKNQWSTGDFCERDGQYCCVSHRQIVEYYQKGDKFPNCRTPSGSEHYATWEFIYTKEEQDEE